MQRIAHTLSHLTRPAAVSRRGRPTTRICALCPAVIPWRFKYCPSCSEKVRLENRRKQSTVYRQRYKPMPVTVQEIKTGYCTRCGCVKLSVEDVSGLCLWCTEETR